MSQLISIEYAILLTAADYFMDRYNELANLAFKSLPNMFSEDDECAEGKVWFEHPTNGDAKWEAQGEDWDDGDFRVTTSDGVDIYFDVCTGFNIKYDAETYPEALPEILEIFGEEKHFRITSNTAETAKNFEIKEAMGG